MSLTNYGENALLNAWLRGGTLPVPTHIGLLTSDPGEPGSGASEVSSSGTGYARIAIGSGATFWGAASGGNVSNASAVDFPEALASWGTVTHFALFDAPSGGNMIASDALTVAKPIETGDIPRFKAGSLVMSAE